MKNLYFFFFLFVGAALIAQESQIPNLKALDQYYAKAQKEWNVPSMVVGIVKDGKLIFSKGYGTKEVGKVETPDEHTLYAIASNTKAFTSAIMATLVEEGILSWNDKVKTHLPYFEVYDTYVSNEANIRDILSHRIGLGTFSGDAIWYKANLSSEQIIRRIKYLPKAYDFRSGYGYSNLMYITAGELIHQVTGKPWKVNVRERILNPLGMSRTLTNSKELVNTSNYATPHALTKDGENEPIVWEDWENIAATGGLISSVSDLSKWLIFNLNHGIWKQDTLFSHRSRNIMWTPHNNHRVNHVNPNDFNTHFSSYGLGWGISDYLGHFRVGHTGGYDGMLTAINLIPDENLGVIVLTNGMKSPMMAVTYYTLNAFLGGEEKDFSKVYLDRRTSNPDSRIEQRKDSRIANSKPPLQNAKLIGNYHSPVYGNIIVSEKEGDLRLDFEHTPSLSASLKHWHYDVWEIDWDVTHAWFSFGTIKFNTDNNLNVTGIDFDVPNNDIFFEELNAKRVK